MGLSVVPPERIFSSFVEVAILGPLEVRDDSGQVVAVPGGRQRALVVLLALNAGKVTSAERLIDDVWGVTRRNSRGTRCRSRCSSCVGCWAADRIETRPPGYALVIADDDVDANRFERLVVEGRAAAADGRREQAVECFDQACVSGGGRHWPSLVTFRPR